MELSIGGQLLELATKFRKGAWVHAHKERGHQNVIYGFPGGCCDSSSRLLAAYLEDAGFSGALYVEGKKLVQGKSKCHVWLNYQGWRIDITADQFDGVEEEVIVCNKDERHLGFRKIGIPTVASYREYYKDDVQGSYDVYESTYCSICTIIATANNQVG